MSFERAVAHVLSWEGGYSNDPRDPGGETRWGISKAAFPDVDVEHLTVDAARALYRVRYWDACRCGELPEPVAFVLFDAAVNSGVWQAVRHLQRALAVKVDGVIGPETIAAANSAPAAKVVRDFTVERLQFYAALSTYPVYGKGWLRRCVDTAMRAA